jgi:predicted transcriptional regulator
MKQKRKNITAREIASELQKPVRTAQNALFRLWKYGLVGRNTYVNELRHIEYKYSLN